VKQTLLALSMMAAFSATSIASAATRPIPRDPSAEVHKNPSTEVYYDTGCRNVVNHYVTRSGEEVTDQHRVCY
jgi:hypothetical protein